MNEKFRNFNKERAEQFSLERFLSYQNPRQKEYEEIIKLEEERLKRSTIGSPPDEYAEEWLHSFFFRLETYENDRKFFAEKLKDDILIDLGAGRRMVMQYFAKEFGARLYIGVERYLQNKLPINTFKNIKEDLHIEEQEKMEIVAVQTDMLDFISRVPNNSANFTLNGIDYIIIQNPNYHYALAQEIVRATKMGGVAFGINADALYSLSKERMREVPHKWKQNDNLIKIFEKIK